MVYGTDQAQTFLGRDLGQGKGYSEAIATEIDSEVRDIVEDGYETARRILTEHMPELHKLAKSKALRYIEPGRARVSLQLPERSQAIMLELAVAQWGRTALLEHKLGADKLGQLPYTIYFDLTSGSIKLIELPQQ